jgi:hypothetical protein
VTAASTALAAAAASVVVEHDTVGALTQLSIDFASLAGASAVGIMIADGDGPLEVLAASAHVARELDLYELQSGEGPCLDAYASGGQVHEETAARITARWPRFGPALVDVGFGSVYACPLRWRGSSIGALNVFLPTDAGLDRETQVVAQAFADIATIAVIQAGIPAFNLAALTHDALQKRTVIEQAKGVLAVTQELDMEGAFQFLLDSSRRDGRRLDVVAQEVIAAAVSQPRD